MTIIAQVHGTYEELERFLTLDIGVQIKHPWYNLFCTRDYSPEAVSCLLISQ